MCFDRKTETCEWLMQIKFFLLKKKPTSQRQLQLHPLYGFIFGILLCVRKEISLQIGQDFAYITYGGMCIAAQYQTKLGIHKSVAVVAVISYVFISLMHPFPDSIAEKPCSVQSTCNPT